MILAIDELEPGMILDEPVRTHQDRLLLEAGRRITERSIRLFKTWGIRRVAVRLPGEKGKPPVSEAIPQDEERILRRLEGRSGEGGNDPVMRELLRAAARQLRLRRLAGEG